MAHPFSSGVIPGLPTLAQRKCKSLQTKDEVLAELMAEHIALKKVLGALSANWVAQEGRDQVVDFVRGWSGKTVIGVGRSRDRHRRNGRA